MGWKIKFQSNFSRGFQFVVHGGEAFNSTADIIATFPTEEAAIDYITLKGELALDPDPTRDCPSCGERGARDPYKTTAGAIRVPRFCRKCSIELAHFRVTRVGGSS